MDKLFSFHSSGLKMDNRAIRLMCDCPIVSYHMQPGSTVYYIEKCRQDHSCFRYVDLGFRSLGCPKFKPNLDCIPMSLKDAILMVIIRGVCGFEYNNTMRILLHNNFMNASKKFLYEFASRNLDSTICDAKIRLLSVWKLIEPDLYERIPSRLEGHDFYGFLVFNGNKGVYVTYNDGTKLNINAHMERVLLEGVAEGKWEAFDDPNELVLRGPF